MTLAYANDTGQSRTVGVAVAAAYDTTDGSFTLDYTLLPTGCGDHFRDYDADEDCDDGNTIDGDGCSSTCQYE